MTKQKKHDLKWIKETLDLRENHYWQSTPGYNVFVAGRGAVRFEVPHDWFFEPDTKSFKFLDQQPPNDNCRLEVSYNHLPPADYTGLPLSKILSEVLDKDERNVLEKGEVVRVKRQTARIVWAELKFLDSQEQRQAYSRICVGIGSGIQCLITFDFWVDDAPHLLPVWDHVMETLTLGLYISDPTTGAAFPD
jgi:hypothetical protein